jgi:hypothetical protein
LVDIVVFFGYAGEQLAVGTKFLFDWTDKNGLAPKIEPRLVSVDLVESIAVVRLEVAGWSGNLAGSAVRMSDLFTLLKMPGGWKIVQNLRESILPDPAAWNVLQCRRRAVERRQPTSAFPLDKGFQSFTNQCRFLCHPSERLGYSYEIIIKCEGCSHEELQALVVALTDVEL